MEYYPPGGLVSATDIRSAIQATLSGTDLQTTPSSVTLVDGLLITYTPTSANGYSYALGLNGSATKYVLRAYNATAGYGSIQSGDIVANCPVVLQYCKDFDAWILINRTYLATSDIPGGLISGKILATVDTSGTGSITGGGYTTLLFTTATNTISTAGSGYYTLTKAGMLTYELRLIVASSRDMEIRSGLNGSHDLVVRKTDTEFIITGLMPVAIGEYIEFTVYNYGSSVSPTSGRLRAALLSI